MAKMTILQAINHALESEMKRDSRIVMLGEDIGRNGGVFRATDGLLVKFGEDRVIDTPLAESAIIGTAVGMSLNGLRPIAEIQFLGFIYEAMDQMASQAARMRFKSAGRFSVPMVIRCPYGGGVRTPELHSDSLEALFSHTPGLKMVMPSNPYDAKGLLISAIRDEDPVLFLEPMKLYRAAPQEVPEDDYEVPIGQAKIINEGFHATIVSWGPPIPLLRNIVEEFEKEDIHLELIDLRTVAPIDIQTILQSVEKTERLLIVHEAVKTNGIGAEIAALVSEKAVFSLTAPILRVTGFDTPYPVGAIEDDWLPNSQRIKESIVQLLSY
ncbi:2-oxoisovalerate dehydrogenase subunit beta [Siminovitchia terrae]|uniref:2-oxoisovalerate dehydrogenase subunit beta n=1 Tax=Siminovitchia terrae TaxID=1914933 RepID=A0ABQ4KTR9_SIMTE|nr:alpha-ketoacid dehydrogenase subunit beta [Siminovitchia terrae]GIN95404.1 2-oxoisovalerate dehydrogenase subunit beta [Siminovitchia terrae]